MRKLSNALAGDAGDGTRGSINRKTGNAHTKGTKNALLLGPCPKALTRIHPGLAEKPLISAVFHGEPLDGGALSLDPGKPTAQRVCFLDEATHLVTVTLLFLSSRRARFRPLKTRSTVGTWCTRPARRSAALHWAASWMACAGCMRRCTRVTTMRSLRARTTTSSTRVCVSFFQMCTKNRPIELCYTSCYRLNPSDPTKSAASLFASYSGSLIFSENVHYSAGSSVFVQQIIFFSLSCIF